MTPKKPNKKNPWKAGLVGGLCVGGGALLFLVGKQQNKVATQFIRSSESKAVETSSSPKLIVESDKENWRGAPVGDGEETIDSYHSYDHRPPRSSDPRDVLLNQYSLHPCPNEGIGTMVSGQDPRYFETNNINFKERNAKFVCDIAKIADKQPCVFYSFGSWDDISYELGVINDTHGNCEVHVFDPFKPPSEETAKRHNFTRHVIGIGGKDTTTGNNNIPVKRLSTIMTELHHKHIDVLKIDVEGAEEGSLPNMLEEGMLDRVDQVAIEFHSVDLMRKGLAILQQAGFAIVYARREDRCNHCTEVSLVKMI